MIELPRIERTAGLPGKPILEVIYGSHAHGTATPTSDVDVRGVYLLPSDDFLGLRRPKTTWEVKAEDRVFWELGHFVQLLLKGNPNLVGLLFAPDRCVLTQHMIANDLVLHRRAFLSQTFRKAYMGWISRERTDLMKIPDQRPKRLSHLPRLVWELMSVYETGEMVVHPSGPKRATIVAIKTGEMDYEDAWVLVHDLIADLHRLDAVYGASLPEPPYEEMNEWLLATRRDFG